jgi:hypothetical protein
MAWSVITPNLVLSRMSLTEQSVFDTKDTSSGEPSRLATVIYDVCQMVRGKIAQWPYIRIRMGPGPSGATPGTIPDELRLAVLNIIRYELLTALPVGDTVAGKQRIQDYADAKDTIELAAKGGMGILGVSDTSYSPDSSIVMGKYRIGWLGRSQPSTFVEDNPPIAGPASGTGPGFPGS